MNFYLVILYGYFLLAGILIYLFNRDRKNPAVLLGKMPWLAWTFMAVLVFGVACGIDARFIEINRLVIHQETIATPDIQKPIRIAFIGDLHVGENKKGPWIQKIVNKIIELNPDVVIIGGDTVYNHGGNLNESEYLEPLRELPKQFPTYYVMGNHEYGYAATGLQLNADQSEAVMHKMKDLGLILLKNQLGCPKLNGERLCLYGIDDVYRNQINFDDLKKWNKTAPLVLIAHNPDGILAWPDTTANPIITLAAHTHGGQIWLPFIGPVGRIPLRLGTPYYRGLNIYNGMNIFTTVGVSESGGPIRFLTPPEIALITLQPQQ